MADDPATDDDAVAAATAEGTGPRILVPIDGSEPSERALRYAAHLARSLGGALTVVHFTDEETDATDAILASARELLAEESVEADPEVAIDVEMDLRPGAHVGEQILERAAEDDVDQVVMGHHGAGTVERAILGSAAETVIRGESVVATVVP